MNAIFNWTITDLDCYSEYQNKNNVVYNVHWRCDGTENNISVFVYGTCVIEILEKLFTPYENLTEQQILNWIWASGIDKTNKENLIQNQINNLKNSIFVTKPLPWNAIT